MTSLVASLKISTGSGVLLAAHWSTARLATNATSFSAPVAMHWLPSKAVQGVLSQVINLSG